MAKPIALEGDLGRLWHECGTASPEDAVRELEQLGLVEGHTPPSQERFAALVVEDDLGVGATDPADGLAALAAVLVLAADGQLESHSA